MTTANKITIARICLVPVFVALIVLYIRGGEEKFRLAAIACFALAAGTDGVDGYIARHYNQKSELGAILDPLADKLLLTAAIVVLSFESHQRFVPIPLWLVILVVTRETILLIGMVAIQRTSGKFSARPRLVGKLSTVLIMAAVLWTMLKWHPAALPYLTVSAGLCVLISGAYYLGDFMRQLKSDDHLLPKSLP